MTFNTAFKHVYAEKLAPYGFQKIKGRKPYLVRMVGDEILQAVSYADAGTSVRPYKDFNVVWGVATVYRPKINLETNPRYENWMKNYVWDASGHVTFQYRDDSPLKPGIHYSVGGNDVDMMEELARSAEAVIQNALPRMDQVKTLEDCMEILGSDAAYVYDLGFEYECDEKEGMLNYKLYTLEEFTARKKKTVDSVEARYKERRTQIMNEQVAIFRKYTEDERYHRKVQEEMERRKAANQEILRGYGLKL